MKKIILLFGICVFLGQFAWTQEGRGHIVVILYGLRNDQGQVKVAIFDKQDGFPDKPEKALAIRYSPVINGKAEVYFPEFEFGTYAIGVIHDENVNGEMDTGIFGIPLEGYGASNDARGGWGPPSFKDAAFLLQTKILQVVINMTY